MQTMAQHCVIRNELSGSTLVSIAVGKLFVEQKIKHAVVNITGEILSLRHVLLYIHFLITTVLIPSTAIFPGASPFGEDRSMNSPFRKSQARATDV